MDLEMDVRKFQKMELWMALIQALEVELVEDVVKITNLQMDLMELMGDAKFKVLIFMEFIEGMNWTDHLSVMDEQKVLALEQLEIQMDFTMVIFVEEIKHVEREEWMIQMDLKFERAFELEEFEVS